MCDVQIKKYFHDILNHVSTFYPGLFLIGAVLMHA